MIGCLRTRVRKQPIIELYFESEPVLKFYNLEARSENKFQAPLNRRYQEVLAKNEHLTIKSMSTGHARHR